MVVKLPLPTDFFKCPPLDIELAQSLSTIGKQTAIELAEYVKVQGGPVQWSLAVNADYIKIYTGIDSSAPSNIASFLIESEVQATLDELSQMYYTPTTESYREYLRVFYNDMKDGARLYNVSEPSPRFPRQFIGVNWNAQEIPCRGFGTKYRDWCFVESHEDVLFDGKKAWARAFRSVDLSCCPDKVFGFSRGSHHRSGSVFVQTERHGILKAFQLLQIESKCGATKKEAEALKRRCIDTASRLERALRGFRMSHTPFVDDETDPSTHCRLCEKKFGLLLRSTNCRKCSKTVCRHATCSDMWDVIQDGKFCSLRICTFCSIAPRPERRRRDRGKNDDDDGQSSVASSERYTTSSVDASSKRSESDVFLDTWRSTLVIDMCALDSIPKSDATTK